MTCNEAQALLNPELDRELDVAKSIDVNTHLAGCPACRSRFLSLSALREVIRDKAARPVVSDVLQRRLKATLPRPSRRTFRWAAPVGSLAAAAALAAVVINLGPIRPGPRSEDQLLENHLRSLQVDHLTDVESSDRHTVKPWFQGKIDYVFPIVDLTEQGFPLIGGRLDQVDHRSVAALVYRRRQHLINVFVWPVERSQNEKAVERGFHLRSWSHDGLQYWAVSDVNADDLATLQQLLESTPP